MKINPELNMDTLGKHFVKHFFGLIEKEVLNEGMESFNCSTKSHLGFWIKIKRRSMDTESSQLKHWLKTVELLFQLLDYDQKFNFLVTSESIWSISEVLDYLELEKHETKLEK